MRRLASILVVLCGLAAHARADYYSSDEPWRKHVEMQLGLTLGGLEAGPYDNFFAVGGDLSLIVPITHKLAVRGEARWSGFSESNYMIEDPIGGIQERLGIAARYRYWDIVPSSERMMRISFYAEAGLGRHTIRWDEGGTLTRNDAGGGLGFELAFRTGKRDKEKSFGIFWEFQMTVAQAPGKVGEPNCQAICDELTPPYGWDFAPGGRMGFSYGF